MHKVGDKRKLSDFTPDGLCVHAFHIAHPYVLTLRNKGWFRWVKDGEGVIAQCPHPRGVVMEIKSGKKGDFTVTIKVIDKRDCPKHEKGDVFIVDDSTKLCPRIFDVAYGYSQKLTKPLKLYCPNSSGVIFKLRKSRT
jgi:uncharacterized repeat protein (TIGR04076 family)